MEGAAVDEAEVEAAAEVELEAGVVTAEELRTVLMVVAEEAELLEALLLVVAEVEATLVVEATELEEADVLVVTGALEVVAGALEDEAEAEVVATPDPAWNCSL